MEIIGQYKEVQINGANYFKVTLIPQDFSNEERNVTEVLKVKVNPTLAKANAAVKLEETDKRDWKEITLTIYYKTNGQGSVYEDNFKTVIEHYGYKRILKASEKYPGYYTDVVKL